MRIRSVPGALDNFVIHQHVPRGGLVKPGNQVQQRGFSAARWSDNAEEFACFHFQIDVVEREQARAVIAFCS